MKHLTVECEAVPKDTVELYGASDAELAVMKCTEQGVSAKIILNHENAREIFNWLGVYLHKGKGL